MKDEPEFEVHFFGMKIAARTRYAINMTGFIVVFVSLVVAFMRGLPPG